MATKYSCTFVSEKGTTYKVDVYDSLFVGSPTEVRALQGGFKISFESESDDINEPIKATSATFNLLVEDSTMESYISALVDRPYGDIFIDIYKSGSIFWSGRVNTAMIKLEHTSFPYAVELNAIDGLGDLQNIKFDDSNMGILTEGNRFKLSQFFADLLNATGLSTHLGTSTFFTTASPLYETQSPTTDDLFNRTYLYTSAFTDQNGNYNLNYHQVLSQLLTAFNCRIMLSNGRFRIIDNRFYDYYTSWKEYVYNNAGVQQSNSTFNNSVTYGTDRIFLADPVIEFDPGLKYVEAKQIADFDLRLDPKQSVNLSFGSSGSALFSVRRQPILGADLSSRTYSPLVGGTNKKLRLQFTIENKGLDPKKLRWINVIIQVTNGSQSKRLSNTYNSFNGINKTTKNSDPYTWVTPSTSQGINIPFSQGQKGKYVIDLPDLPYANCSVEYLAFMIMGDYDIVRAANIFNNSYTITNLDTTDIVTGMVVQDYDVAGRIQLSPAVTLSAVNSNLKTATMNTLYTNAGGFRNIGFLIPANDIQTGDESSVSLTIDSFTYLPQGVNVDNEGYIYSSTNDDLFTEQFFTDNLYFGDGFNIQNKNTLYVANSFGTIFPSSAWTIKPSLEVQNSGPLLQKLTQSILWHQYKGLKRYNGTIFTTGYNPHQAIIKGSEKLVFVGGEFVAEMDEWSGSWAVWQYRPDAYVSSSKGNGTKASNTDITKNIYPHIDFPKLDNDIKVIDSVLGNMATALAVYRQMVMDAEKISLDYIGSDPQFKVQTTGSTITATTYKEGDVFISTENGKIWQVINGSITQVYQAAAAGSTGITTIGTIDSQTKSANGLVISGSDLVAQTADASNVGMVSTGTQTFAGAKTFNAAVTLLRSIISGTGGNGYTELPSQSSAPSTPASGFRFFADSLSRFAWRGLNGFLRILDGTGNTADRTYTLQDKSGTLAHTSDIRVDTRGQLSSAVTLGNTTTRTLLHTITIPAGTLVSGDSVKVQMVFTCNNNANSKVGNITINTTTGTMCGTITMTTHTGGIMEVTFKVTSATNIRALNMNNSQSYNITSGASPRDYTVSDIASNSFTIDIYGQKVTAGTDTLILEHSTAIIQKS